MHMFDFFNPGIFLLCNIIKSEIFSQHGKGGIERAKRLHIRVRTDCFVMIQNCHT